MKAFWIALGIVGTIPLLAAGQTYPQQQQPARSVIKPVGFHLFAGSGCGCQEAVPTCAAPAPGCCTPVPAPAIGRCCPKPCLLERLHRGLRSLDCLLPCSLGCNSINCHSTCGPSCHSCTASCETRSSCGSCCTKSRAHFFAFCKPKCFSSCAPSCCAPTCGTPCHVGCCDGVPMGLPVPQPMDDNPFKDDVRPLDMPPMENRPMDPNAPPPGQNTYKPYWKKNTATARVAPQPHPTPAKLDPYAVAPPVHIKARPVQSSPVQVKPLPANKVAVKVAIAQEVETVSHIIADDEPPAPPGGLPTVVASPIRYESSIPVNPLRR